MKTKCLWLLLLTAAFAGCLSDGSDADENPDGQTSAPEVVRVVQVDAERWSGEPSILAMQDGTLLITGAGGLTRYVEDPTDAPGKFGQSYLWRSIDDGETWTFVDLGLPEAVLPYRNAILGVEGDLAEDEAGTAYFVDLNALVANGISSSSDSGETWTDAQTPAVGLPGTDRPWVAALGDGEVWVKYLSMAPEGPTGPFRVAYSADGAQTFLTDESIGGCGQADLTVDVPAQEVLVPCTEGTHLYLQRSPAGGVDFERVESIDVEGNPNNVFVSAAVARTGEYIFTWAETTEWGVQVRMTVSQDRGETWSPAVDLSSNDGTAVFPWVDADTEGNVAVVWYQADQVGPSDTLDAAWYPTIATFHLAEEGIEGLHTQAITEEKVHQGAICTSGLGCVLDGRAEDRRLLDFFEVDMDAGTAHVTWTNTQTDVPTIWYGQVGPSTTTP